MESAIPQHLRCPRTHAARGSEEHVPSYPAWVARLNPGVTQVAMGYFGVQYKGPKGRVQALHTVASIRQSFAVEAGPRHHDVASYVDEAGFETLIVIAYWDDAQTFRHWLAIPSLEGWWNDSDRTRDEVGYFREFICPRVEYLETLSSSLDRFEGLACVAQGHSGEIREHGYWGSARDRLPSAQTDDLRASGSLTLSAEPRPGKRVLVMPHDHVALIRSGQEWTEMDTLERQIYFGDVEPVLRQAMDFLRDDGLSVGCYLNRFMHHVDERLRPVQKSFGMSFWRSLGHLEAWSEHHPTHVNIFGSFMRMVQAMNFNPKLRLYHEVVVATADEQFYEYVNCHPRTGLLRAGKTDLAG